MHLAGRPSVHRRLGVLAVRAAVLLAPLAACGLDLIGATDGSTEGGPVVVDGGATVSADGSVTSPAPPDLCERSTCVPTLPEGWSFASPVSVESADAGVPVTEQIDPAVSCPDGWTSVARYFDDPRSASG